MRPLRSFAALVGCGAGTRPGRRQSVKLYRINKVAGPSGPVLKKKDVLAASDREAIRTAQESADCPICEVLRDGQPIGSIT